jgi:hypothetical protein
LSYPEFCEINHLSPHNQEVVQKNHKKLKKYLILKISQKSKKYPKVPQNFSQNPPKMFQGEFF